jgi:hypothetical protein
MKHKYVQFQLDACVKCSFQLDEILMQHDILGSVFFTVQTKMEHKHVQFHLDASAKPRSFHLDAL